MLKVTQILAYCIHMLNRRQSAKAYDMVALPSNKYPFFFHPEKKIGLIIVP